MTDAHQAGMAETGVSCTSGSRLAVLPRIMLAPNGARRGKRDHPALPITLAETVAAAKDGFEIGRAHV